MSSSTPSRAASVVASRRAPSVGVEVGDAGIVVVDHRHAVGEGAVILCNGAVMIGAGIVNFGGRAARVLWRDLAE
jgi:hypothetical protein